MKCIELFENIKQYWPSEFSLDDDTLNKQNVIYWELEAKIDSKNEHWLDISSWAFHQTLGIYSKLMIAEGRKKVLLCEVPVSIFNTQMLSNLENESWVKERGEYEPM